MKQSFYNLFYRLEGGKYLAYNSLRNGLAVIDQPILDFLTNEESLKTDSVDQQIVKELCRGGFLIDDNLDEFKFNLISRRIDQFATNTLRLIIAPTLDCNFSCRYCYLSRQRKTMTEDTASNIVSFAKKYLESGANNLRVSWYGGEPLLCMGIIEIISEELISLCTRLGINYYSTLVTNGSLYSKINAELLKSFKVNFVQITLDGDEDSHNKRRPYRNGMPSFIDIVSNLENTVGIIPIAIRVNIDSENVGKIPDFIDNLRANNWFDSQHISLYFGHIRKYSPSCQCKAEELLTLEDFWLKEIELYKELQNKLDSSQSIYPARPYSCTAVSLNSYIIGPCGELYKCCNDLGRPDRTVGSVLDFPILNSTYIQYLADDIDEDTECRKCKVLPLCLGGCRYLRLKSNESNGLAKDCSKWKTHLELTLRQYLLRKFPDESFE